MGGFVHGWCEQVPMKRASVLTVRIGKNIVVQRLHKRSLRWTNYDNYVHITQSKRKIYT